MAVVIVADDFGLSTPINLGIVRAFDEHLITCTSMIANMPAFEEAVSLARVHDLDGRIGVHLNLVEGISLTKPIRGCPRFAQQDGTLIWRHRNVWSLSSAEREGIAMEWRAQVQRIIGSGITPTHLDSHMHTHTSWPLGTIAIALAREFGIRHLRLSRNCGPLPRLPVRAYKALFNARVHRAELSRTQFFGPASEMREVIATARGPVEVMTHPELATDGRLINHTDGMLLAPSILALQVGDRARSYREIE